MSKCAVRLLNPWWIPGDGHMREPRFWMQILLLAGVHLELCRWWVPFGWSLLLRKESAHGTNQSIASQRLVQGQDGIVEQPCG